MFISKKNHLSEVKSLQDKINELEEQIKNLQSKLLTLQQQQPQIIEISKVLTDLQRLSGSMLSIQRMDPTEVYQWRG